MSIDTLPRHSRLFSPLSPSPPPSRTSCPPSCQSRDRPWSQHTGCCPVKSSHQSRSQLHLSPAPQVLHCCVSGSTLHTQQSHYLLSLSDLSSDYDLMLGQVKSFDPPPSQTSADDFGSLLTVAEGKDVLLSAPSIPPCALGLYGVKRTCCLCASAHESFPDDSRSSSLQLHTVPNYGLHICCLQKLQKGLWSSIL